MKATEKIERKEQARKSIMKINQNKIENPAALPIESVEVINDNNW